MPHKTKPLHRNSVKDRGTDAGGNNYVTKKYRWRGTNAITISPLYAQHAFAEMSLSAGIPIENIAKMKGHVSISSTQIYALMTACKISA